MHRGDGSTKVLNGYRIHRTPTPFVKRAAALCIRCFRFPPVRACASGERPLRHAHGRRREGEAIFLRSGDATFLAASLGCLASLARACSLPGTPWQRRDLAHRFRFVWPSSRDAWLLSPGTALMVVSAIREQNVSSKAQGGGESIFRSRRASPSRWRSRWRACRDNRLCRQLYIQHALGCTDRLRALLCPVCQGILVDPKRLPVPTIDRV